MRLKLPERPPRSEVNHRKGGIPLARNILKTTILPIGLAGLWITASEFVRNEIFFKSHWTGHFRSLGLEFKTLPLNGALWMVWSFILAYAIFFLLRHMSLKRAMLLAWLTAFVLMWVTAFNLQVLPVKLLMAAVPLSLLEVAVAGLIIKTLESLRRSGG